MVLHLPPVDGDLATYLGDDRTLPPKCMRVSVIFVVRSHILRVIISPFISSAIVATRIRLPCSFVSLFLFCFFLWKNIQENFSSSVWILDEDLIVCFFLQYVYCN